MYIHDNYQKPPEKGYQTSGLIIRLAERVTQRVPVITVGIHPLSPRMRITVLTSGGDSAGMNAVIAKTLSSGPFWGGSC